jgi:GH24 family phage-related lysozyme (muramidase)
MRVASFTVLLVLVLSRSATPAAPPAIPAARAAFERFRALEGSWRGKSTKGWTDTAVFRTIAGGSVVTETSFDAHPGETMLTAYHLDGDRLLLTHYCVAQNQPRLVASTIEEGGGTVTFTFLDGTNLPSRDRGHMDKAVFRFEDADHFTSRWTWYQDGTERWMEEIRMERVRTAPAVAAQTEEGRPGRPSCDHEADEVRIRAR